nr:tetratricopeptide repeat protein [Armatimonadota bacterium]
VGTGGNSVPAIPSPAGPATPLGRTIEAARSHAPALAHAAFVRTASTLPDTGTTPKGAGLLVCDPVVHGADASTAQFADGCSAWLHFTVAGLPQFGRTPLPSARQRLALELGRESLSLDLKGAQHAAAMLGVTHFVVGQIEGSALRASLSYQLVEAASGKSVGTPLVASGTPDQIAALLPETARRIALLMNSPAPSVPALTRISAGDIALLGDVEKSAGNRLEGSQFRRLQDMAGRVPLAGAYAIGDSNSRIEQDRLASQLLALAPENGLAWGMVGEADTSLLKEHGEALNGLFHRYPNNFLFATCNAWLQRDRQDREAEEACTVASVRRSPANPDGWLTLAAFLSDEANDLRQDQPWKDIDAKDQATLAGLYAQWTGAAAEAIALDPLYGKAWLQLAQASCVHGDNTLADAAFWKAVQLDPEKVEVYGWGLTMYGSHWLNQQDHLVQVARLSAFEPYAEPSGAAAAAKDLNEAGFKDEAKALLARSVTQWQAAVQKYPDDPRNRFNLGLALKAAGRAPDAIVQLQAFLALQPDDIAGHYELADALDQQKRPTDAMGQYREVLRLDPAHPSAHFDLACDLRDAGRPDEAMTELGAAIHADPTLADAHSVLGDLLSDKDNLKGAIVEYQKAADLNPDSIEAAIGLSSALADDGQSDKAIAAGQKAVELAPEDARTHDALADAFASAQRPEDAIKEDDDAIQINPDDATAHMNRGDSLMDLNRRDEAQDEWKKVVSLDHGAMAEAAQKRLSEPAAQPEGES